MGETDVRVRIGGDISGLDSALRKATGSMDNFVNGRISSFGRLKNSIFGVQNILMSFGAAFAISKVSNYVKEITRMAGRYDELGIAMYQAGTNAGYSQKYIDELEQSLRKTGISMTESRNNITKMASANMDLVDATKLARVAQDLAVIGHMNSSEAFSRLIYALQSGQVEMLRTIGLNVSFEEGYKKTATALGKTTNELTQQEKIQSRVNTTLQAASTYQGIYEKSMSSAEKQMGTMQRYIDDYHVAFGKAFQPAYLEIVKSKTEMYKQLAFVVSDPEFQDSLLQIANSFSKEYINLVKLVPEFVKLLETLGAIKSFMESLPPGIISGTGAGIIGAILFGGTAGKIIGVVVAINEQLKYFNMSLGDLYNKSKGIMDMYTALTSKDLSGVQFSIGKRPLNEWGGVDIPRMPTFSPKIIDPKKAKKEYDNYMKSIQMNNVRHFQAPNIPSGIGERTEKRIEDEKQWLDSIKKSSLAEVEYAKWAEEQKNQAYQNIYSNDEKMLGLNVERHKAAMDEISKNAQTTFGEEMRNAMEGWASGWSDTLNEMLWGADSTFEDILKSFLKMITQMLIQKQIIEPLFTSAFGNEKTGSSGWINMAATAIAAYFAHSGGIIGGSSIPKKSVHPSLFINAPRLHKGLRNDEYPAILQKGERVIPRGESGGNGQTVQYNYSFAGATFWDMAQFRAAIRAVSLETVHQHAPDAVMRDYHNDGKIRNLIGPRY